MLYTWKKDNLRLTTSTKTLNVRRLLHNEERRETHEISLNMRSRVRVRGRGGSDHFPTSLMHPLPQHDS